MKLNSQFCVLFQNALFDKCTATYTRIKRNLYDDFFFTFSHSFSLTLHLHILYPYNCLTARKLYRFLQFGKLKKESFLPFQSPHFLFFFILTNWKYLFIRLLYSPLIFKKFNLKKKSNGERRRKKSTQKDKFTWIKWTRECKKKKSSICIIDFYWNVFLI